MMQARGRDLVARVTGLAFIALLVVGIPRIGSASETAGPVPVSAVSPPSYTYLPLVARGWGSYSCPITSANEYSAGIAYQYDLDDPVRPEYDHADKNLNLPGYAPSTNPDLQRELVNYGTDDPTLPPQLATMFDPCGVPPLSGFYQVYDWNWAPSPDPGSRGDPLASYPVTALGLQTAPGQALHVPVSVYDIGGGMEVLVLFADENTIALRYTREDSSASQGYTLHVDNICTDPNLLALYNALDDPDGARYEYHESRSYAYDLPTLAAGQPFGTARGSEVVVAIMDTGSSWTRARATSGGRSGRGMREGVRGR